MLKILQARLQQYVNRELPDVQARFRKGRGTRDQIANILWTLRKQENTRKTSTSASLTMKESEKAGLFSWASKSSQMVPVAMKL